MLTFRLIDTEEIESAHNWYQPLAEQNQFLLTRKLDEYRAFASSKSLWCAARENDQYQGGIYYHREDGNWEIGGLVVEKFTRRSGIGLTLLRLALADVLIEHEPLKYKQKVYCKIHKENDLPRSIITDGLKFNHAFAFKEKMDENCGLLMDSEGFIHGDTFEVTNESVLALIDWLIEWKNHLKSDVSTFIKLRENDSLDAWVDDLRSMV